MSVKISKATDIDKVVIGGNEPVTVTKMGHLIEVQHMTHGNYKARIKKLSKYHYVDLGTGEIKEFELSKTRADNVNSVRQTFKKMRYLINNNFTGADNELFITLTYSKQTRDHLQVGRDYVKFLQRLRRRYKGFQIEGIRILEPHASGCWHLHALLKLVGSDTFDLDIQTLKNVWGLALKVDVRRLNDVDNIGAYLSAYLGNVEIPEGTTYNGTKEVVEHKGKKYIKGARLAFYPPGVNIYAKTPGIKYPERQYMDYADIKKVVRSTKAHYRSSVTITDEKKNFTNTITYEQYNLKRQ